MLNHFKKHLRTSQTDAENVLWYHFRNRHFQGFKFRRQHILCGYIVDFVCLEKRLIIELDGGQHIEQKEHDAIRTRILEADRFRLLRFWNHEVFNNINGVMEMIYNALQDSIYMHQTPLTRRAKSARRPLPQGER